MRRVYATIFFVLLASCDDSDAKTETKQTAPSESKADANATAKADTKTESKSDTKAEPEPPVGNPALLDPTLAKDKAPDKYKAKFETTEGEFVIEVHRAWAPEGADRFYNLVKSGYYDDVAFFRAVEGFMVQFGIHGNPRVNGVWRNARFKDDPVKESNKKGYVTFAKSNAPNSRTTQVFINFGDNATLDKMGFAPFGKVVEGMDVVNKLHTGYGDGPPSGRGPNQQALQSQGNAYLKERFPELDYVKKASVVEDDKSAKSSKKKSK
jgi:peptidyl-prolyl cis-trans isomerase A (cyclophilin A)